MHQLRKTIARGEVRRRRRNNERIDLCVVQRLHRCGGVNGWVFVHCSNGGYRQAAKAAIFSARARVADLSLWHNGKSFALQFNAANGRPSEARPAFLADFDRDGGCSAVAEGLDRALRTHELWGLFLGTAT